MDNIISTKEKQIEKLDDGLDKSPTVLEGDNKKQKDNSVGFLSIPISIILRKEFHRGVNDFYFIKSKHFKYPAQLGTARTDNPHHCTNNTDVCV